MGKPHVSKPVHAGRTVIRPGCPSVAPCLPGTSHVPRQRCADNPLHPPYQMLLALPQIALPLNPSNLLAAALHFVFAGVRRVGFPVVEVQPGVCSEYNFTNAVPVLSPWPLVFNPLAPAFCQ